MRRLITASRQFKKQLKKLPPQAREKAIDALKHFLAVLQDRQIPAGLGFKKINGNKYELRVDIRLRIVMVLDGDTFVCHLVGSHDTVQKFLKSYRTSD